MANDKKSPPHMKAGRANPGRSNTGFGPEPRIPTAGGPSAGNHWVDIADQGRLWGLGWTVSAGQAGWQVAAASPLPGHDEAVARVIAKRFASSPSQRAFAQSHADGKARDALAKFREAKRISHMMSRGAPTERLKRKFAEAIAAADLAGRAAAKAHRVLILMLTHGDAAR